MTTKRKVIAACIATLFVSGSAFSKDSWQLHENEWGNVNSYGKVAVAQDSVDQWGPWEDFVQPAAGAPSPVSLPGMSSADRYRNNPVVTGGNSGCGGGDWCGYAALYSEGGNYQKESYFQYEHQIIDVALRFLQSPGEWDGSGSLSLHGIGANAAAAAMLGQDTGAVPSWFYGAPGLFEGYRSTENDGRQTYVSLETVNYDSEGYYSTPYDPTYVAVGQLYAYTSAGYGGYGGYGGESDYVQIGAPFVVGKLTSATDMSALQAGKVTAEYYGTTLYPHYGSNNFGESPVKIAVNFGNATWSGEWNKGRDGYTHTHGPDSSGTQTIFGQVGFTAQGAISGSNFSSNSVGTLDTNATVTGNVRGSFYGPMAAAVGGATDITKTYSSSSDTMSRIASVATPTTTSYRNVDLFIATKVDPREFAKVAPK